MNQEAELYEKFDEVQNLFIDVEVLVVELPIDSLLRIQEYCLDHAKCVVAASNGREFDKFLESAGRSLDLAEYHCKKLLADAYYCRTREMVEMYEKDAVRKVDNGGLASRLMKGEVAALQALEEAERLNERYSARCAEHVQARYPALPKECERFVDELEIELAQCNEVRAAYSNAYALSKEYYEMLADKEIRDALAHYDDNGGRNKKSNRIASALNCFSVLASAFGVLCFVVGRLLG